VAYVTDASCTFFGGSGGIEDTHFPGCSILKDAVTGLPIPNGGSFTTTGGHVVKFTDVPVSAIDAGGLGAISGYDTVMLFQVCDFGSHPNLVSALNTYLTSGLGKVIIDDGDWCAPGDGGSPNYSAFLFPFTSSNPGPRGASGTVTFVETESPPAVVTRSLTLGTPTFNDAIGDSNTFASNTGGWCAATKGTNALGADNIQVGYARTTSGGLALYSGNDNFFTFGANAWDAAVFNNFLDQPFNPDSLPCGLPVTGIKLDPATATNPAGGIHTVTATLVNVNTGAAIVGATVTFTVTSGPNAGLTGKAVTDAGGHATFTYSDTGGVGVDSIVATFTDVGGVHTSNVAQKTWTPRPSSVSTKSSQTGAIIPTTSVTDTATVTGSGAAPLPDLTGSLSFQLCGPNPVPSTTLNCAAAGTVAITTPNGGTFSATSPAQTPTAGGSYCWTATYSPATGAGYAGSSSTTTTNECFSVLQSTTQGRMTGGGTIANTLGTPDTAKHGFELHCDVTSSPNNLEVNWAGGNKFHLTSLTSAFCVNDPTIVPNPPAAGFDTYIGTGTGELNGAPGHTIYFIFTDAGEPGTSDHAVIMIDGGAALSVSGFLSHGNQQAHK